MSLQQGNIQRDRDRKREKANSGVPVISTQSLAMFCDDTTNNQQSYNTLQNGSEYWYVEHFFVNKKSVSNNIELMDYLHGAGSFISSCHSADQEITHFLWNIDVNYHFHNNLPQNCNITQVKKQLTTLIKKLWDLLLRVPPS
jgi:hypothetical protein